MIILLSPTKTFTNNLVNGNNYPVFKDKTNFLVNIIKKHNLNDIKKTFKQSGKISNDIFNYYLNYSEKYIACYLYGGTSFKYLDATTINQNKLSKLYIFSALYGLNNALNNISYYRLDMKDKLENINLYNFWKDDLNNYLDNNFSNKLIINLASAEYYKMINVNKNNIITIDFKISNKKISSMELKKMRGLFARELLINDFNNLEDIKLLNIENYHFNKELSTNNKLIFERSN